MTIGDWDEGCLVGLAQQYNRNMFLNVMFFVVLQPAAFGRFCFLKADLLLACSSLKAFCSSLTQEAGSQCSVPLKP